MLDNLRADYQRLRDIRSGSNLRVLVDALLFDSGFQAVTIYRMAHAIKKLRIPFLAPCLSRFGQWLTGVEIAPATQIGPGLMISHGQGIVVGQWTRIGRDCHLHQQVTLGAKDVGRIDQMPTLGDGVLIGSGAKLLGGITVGDGALVGPNAFLTRDVPAGGKALAPQAEVRPPRSSPQPSSSAPSPPPES